MFQTLKITEIKKCVTKCRLHLITVLIAIIIFIFVLNQYGERDVSSLGTQKTYIILL